MSDETMICFGKSLKALGDGRIGGYLVAWGDRNDTDLTDEYFSKATDFMLDRFPVVDSALVLYHHAQDATLKGRNIGTFTSVRADDVGLWAEAQLDLADEYAARYTREIERLAAAGKLSWSSGSAPQLVERDRDGHIRRWPIVEGSLTPTPAQPVKTRIHSVKSLPDAPTLTELLAIEAAAHGDENTAGEGHTKTKTEDSTMHKNVSEIIEAVVTQIDADLTAEDVVALAAAIEGADPDAVAAVEDADENEIGLPDEFDEEKASPVQKAVYRLVQLIGKHVEQKKAAKKFSGKAMSAALRSNNAYAQGIKATAPRSGDSGATKRAPWADNGAPAEIHNLSHKAKWANLSPVELSAVVNLTSMLNANQPAHKRIELKGIGALYQTLGAHALESAEKRDFSMTPDEIRAAASLKSISHVKANELDNTGQTDYGAEFVHTIWGNVLVEHARRDNVVAPLLDSFNMNAQIVKEPVRGLGRGTVYNVTESTADTHQNVTGSTIPDSKIQTDNRTFTAKKLGVRVGWSSEIDEDSIVPFAQYTISTMTENMQRSIDHVLLMGDVATSGNINYDGGTPTGNEDYTVFDGIFKNGLANGVDGQGDGFTYADFLAARFKLNREANGALNDIVFFAPPELEHHILDLDEVVTLEKFGPAASILTGQVARLGGIPIVITPVIQLAASDGKITYNAAGTLARGVMVYRPAWKIGWRRNPEPYLWTAPDGESIQVTLTVRLDMQNSQQSGIASAVYNVTG